MSARPWRRSSAVEQGNHNPLVGGSNPSAATRFSPNQLSGLGIGPAPQKPNSLSHRPSSCHKAATSATRLASLGIGGITRRPSTPAATRPAPHSPPWSPPGPPPSAISAADAGRAPHAWHWSRIRKLSKVGPPRLGSAASTSRTGTCWVPRQLPGASAPPDRRLPRPATLANPPPPGSPACGRAAATWSRSPPW